MITQSFLYNAIFFTYALVLINFYHVPSNKVPLYGLAFSIGNLAGPLILGPLFDSWGRKQMIAGTYLVSGVLLGLSAVMFDAGVLNATTQTLMWVIVLLLRLRPRQRRLPDRLRNLADRDPRQGDRHLLRHRLHRRRPRPRLLRRPDRHRHLPDPAVLGVSDRRRHHDHRRAGRGLPRRQRRRQITGTGHQATPPQSTKRQAAPAARRRPC